MQLCFWVVNEVPERNDWICESRYMSSSKCLRVFCGILFVLKAFRDYSLCSVCILPQSAFYSQGAIHSTKIPTGPTGKRGPPQKADPFFRNFSGWTEPIHCVLDRNFRKFWLNGSRPCSVKLTNRVATK